MPKSPEEYAHLEWLGYVQPVGLVVSIPAMLEAQCYVNKNIMGEHARFLSCLPRNDDDTSPKRQREESTPIPEIRDLPEFTRQVFGWEAEDLVPLSDDSCPLSVKERLTIALPQYHEVLRPTHVVFEFDAAKSPATDNRQLPTPLMLIQELVPGTDLDQTAEADSAKHWNAAPQAKFERLLRETQVPIGLLSNGRQLRLVYSPRGETSGHATFNVDEMVQVAGRPMFAALHMLLCTDRMFSLGDNQRLPAILQNSRKYQNTVSTKLAEQVLAALYELMRGFQAANDVRKGELLREVLASDPNHVYSGLLTVLMRLVFVMYAEDRDLLSSDPVYSNYYSVTGLFNRLREDAGRFPDTMDQRFGAWSQLITLFRLVYEGGQHGDFKIPPRKGYLFDPDRYPFLEGRGSGIGVGEWGIERTKHHEREFVSRPASLASGHRPDGVLLSRDEDVSEGRDVRADESDPTRCQLNSGEHRGGTRARQEGVSSVPENRAGQSNGTGNTLDHRTEGSDSPGLEPSTTFGDNGPIGTDANQTSTITSRLTQSPSPTPHPPIPSPHPQIPRVSDGVIYRVLRNLLILDGERLSYRTLDVEQIGSVYETVMGFNLEVAAGKSIAIKPTKSHGAPATINLDALLETKGKDRAKWLKDQSDQSLGAAAAKQLKDATTIDGLLEALDKKIQKKVTPRVVPAGAIVLQPSDERRRSGSHYTPRSLTEPIVRTTLEPILKQLADPDAELPTVYEPTRDDKKRYTPGELQARIRLSEKAVEAAKHAREIGTPHPSQILDLKICDPAMGSGAFLVETCRQLGDELVKAWYAHYKNDSPLAPSSGRGAGGEGFPSIPPDEDEVLYARRQVAQRCLYGVDKNDMAVDLAKLSLWLVTLAKDHPFTFLDHSLRHGDSLVGLARRQIIGFHWEPKKQKQFGEELIQKRLDRATEARAKILNAREDVPYRDQEQRLAVADDQLEMVRMIADACVSAFFEGKKNKDREENVDHLFGIVTDYVQSLATSNQQLTTSLRSKLAAAAASLRSGEHPIPPFHWEIEFPEVFSRPDGGFDALVGNPPFAGKNTLINGNRAGFPDWLKSLHSNSHGNADLVAHFFRRAFSLLNRNGCFGLIATNTIGQGDTRSTGLRVLCKEKATIFAARRRYMWPGVAAVVVSVVHVCRGNFKGQRLLEGKPVDHITAYLFQAGNDDDPSRLQSNASTSFQGSNPLGMGFIFDDNDVLKGTTPISEMARLIRKIPENADRIFPYIGGEEVNNSPTHSHHRFIINFEHMSLDEANRWPDLLAIIEQKVKPEREALPQTNNWNRMVAANWWQFGAWRQELAKSIAHLERVLVIPRICNFFTFTFIPRRMVHSGQLVVFATDDTAWFAVLQSRIHECWVRLLSSSMKDDLRYAQSDCYETFPFPADTDSTRELGNAYYAYRADVLVSRGEGLTKTFRRFHDPLEKSEQIQKLRELHSEMDCAVLRAYGWDDLAQMAHCEYLLDFEESKDEESDGKSTRSRPWRLRWPDEFRDEVLGRLLELNEVRAKTESLTGLCEAASVRQLTDRSSDSSSKTAAVTSQRNLFE